MIKTKWQLNKSEDQIKFTGEFLVPGQSGERLEADHMARYCFACNYVKKREILDIACGFGYAGPLIMKAGATRYEGVDINKQLIDNANLLYGTDYIKYYQGDISSYNAGKLFDVIVCFETIEHVTKYQNALLNMNNLLRKNGLLIISSPNRPVTSPNARYLSDKPSNRYHAQEFTIKELRSELINAGFLVENDNIFGQRNCFFNFTNRRLNRLAHLIFGDPSIKSSPNVSRTFFKTPRYFVIVASK